VESTVHQNWSGRGRGQSQDWLTEDRFLLRVVSGVLEMGVGQRLNWLGRSRFGAHSSFGWA
jgi:hypothetical protein